jgi:hypothetical protein
LRWYSKPRTQDPVCGAAEIGLPMASVFWTRALDKGKERLWWHVDPSL